MNDGMEIQPHHQIVLGTFGAAHLGDTLCTSTLPRRIHAKYGKPIYIADYPMLRAVFNNNPHVAGFGGRATLALDRRMRGHGHVLQRLEQGLGLPIDPLPKPEIYLNDDEREWAGEQRRKWGADRPVCAVSTGAITDRRNVEGVDWETLSRILAGMFTVVQPVLSEKELPDAIVHRGLSVRKYMALISVADYFVGGTSGGSHVAAAFDVPALTRRASVSNARP